MFLHAPWSRNSTCHLGVVTLLEIILDVFIAQNVYGWGIVVLPQVGSSDRHYPKVSKKRKLLYVFFPWPIWFWRRKHYDSMGMPRVPQQKSIQPQE